MKNQAMILEGRHHERESDPILTFFTENNCTKKIQNHSQACYAIEVILRHPSLHVERKVEDRTAKLLFCKKPLIKTSFTPPCATPTEAGAEAIGCILI